MSGIQINKIKVFESPIFKKVFQKFKPKFQIIVDDEINKIIDTPDLGEQKKGDLSFLWVHKFKLDNKEVLLGYSWVDDKLELYLLNLSSHENFYRDAKKRRKIDLSFIK